MSIKIIIIIVIVIIIIIIIIIIITKTTKGYSFPLSECCNIRKIMALKSA